MKRKHSEKDDGVNDGFQTVRKPRKFANGTSQVKLDDIAPAGLAGPVDYYICNTDKRADGDIIKRVLKKCAAPIEGGNDLEVLEVELLNTEENQRTKCWRVSVPFKFKVLMENDELYPPGWKHRRFFGARKRKENQAKKGRVEPDQVDAMLRERELEAESLRLSNEEEIRKQTVDMHGLGVAAGTTIPGKTST